jgi:5'-nucleotidase
MKTLLIDMDGVLADTLNGFNKRLSELYPQIPLILYENLNEFYLENCYPKEYRKNIESIWKSKNLFLDLSPMPGAIEAIDKLRKISDICICSSPFEENPTGVQDKWDWIIKYFGKSYTKRLILTRDKTRVSGDYLIDDKPVITGSKNPSWEHILYSHPWNKNINKKRLTWQNWQEVLLPLL